MSPADAVIIALLITLFVVHRETDLELKRIRRQITKLAERSGTPPAETE